MSGGLKYGERAALSGKPTSLVIFLHGYGADGADLLGLADPLAPHLPDTRFAAPDAPQPCLGAPYGRQWFPIPWLDRSSEAEALAGLQSAARALDAFIDQRMEEMKIAPQNVVLFGFSQGAMMAMHVAPRREKALAGVVAIAGRLLRPERLEAETLVRPPILLIHGDADPVVPFGDMALAGQALDAAGFETFGHVMQGTGHGIANDGLSVALAFMRDRLAG